MRGSRSITVSNRLFEPEQTLYKMSIRTTDNSLFVQVTFTFFWFLCQDMTFERLLVGDLAGAGHFKPLFGTWVGLYLWHFCSFFDYTLLAGPHRRTTFGALWAIKWSAKVTDSFLTYPQITGFFSSILLRPSGSFLRNFRNLPSTSQTAQVRKQKTASIFRDGL